MNYQYILKPKENGLDYTYTESKSKSTPVAMVAPELKQHNGYLNEITKTCAVLGCEDYKHVESDALFRFPEDPELRQIWANLTGRNNWTPTDFSYICISHFTVDSFVCLSDNSVVLMDKAVPSIKLPGHVLEVEYIDEDTLENDESCNEMEYEYLEQSDTELTNTNHNHSTYSTADLHPTSSTAHLHPTSSTAHLHPTSSTAHLHPTSSTAHLHPTSSTAHLHPTSSTADLHPKSSTADSQPENQIELLKLFTQVQKMQRQANGLKEKLKINMRLYNQQSKYLQRLENTVDTKRKVLEKRKKKKSRILLSLQDKIKEDTNGLVLAMPMKYSDDLKNFALNVYKYSPQAYIYVRNTLRTMLPSTEVLQGWLKSSFHPKKLINSKTTLNVVAEQNDKELSCKITLK